MQIYGCELFCEFTLCISLTITQLKWIDSGNSKDCLALYPMVLSMKFVGSKPTYKMAFYWVIYWKLGIKVWNSCKIHPLLNEYREWIHFCRYLLNVWSCFETWMRIFVFWFSSTCNGNTMKMLMMMVMVTMVTLFTLLIKSVVMMLTILDLDRCCDVSRPQHQAQGAPRESELEVERPSLSTSVKHYRLNIVFVNAFRQLHLYLPWMPKNITKL